jgi:DNA-binding LytR/AlgR family response regulator
LKRWWPAGLAAYAWLASVVGTSWYVWRGRVAVGATADVGSILIWQALVYGLWLPVGTGLLLLVRRFGLGLNGLKAAAALCLPMIFLHALGASLLDLSWSPRVAELGLVGAIFERLPVSLLVYMVLVGAVWTVAAQREASVLAAALRSAREAPPTAPAEEETLLVSLGQRRVPVPIAAVEWLGAAGNYVVVNWDGRDGLVRSTLAELEQRLDPARFARIHRSTIANLAMVDSASSLSDGSWRLIMKSGAELVASRTYRDRILDRLGRR